MKIRLWEIYKVFVKIGMILIGGGYVILPILKDEIIKSKNWITEDELVDYYAISQSLPGLIAANISISDISYKFFFLSSLSSPSAPKDNYTYSQSCY